jgi:hypothetical protein
MQTKLDLKEQHKKRKIKKLNCIKHAAKRLAGKKQKGKKVYNKKLHSGSVTFWYGSGSAETYNWIRTASGSCFQDDNSKFYVQTFLFFIYQRNFLIERGGAVLWIQIRSNPKLLAGSGNRDPEKNIQDPDPGSSGCGNEFEVKLLYKSDKLYKGAKIFVKNIREKKIPAGSETNWKVGYGSGTGSETNWKIGYGSGS